jgi:hypothetical protein
MGRATQESGANQKRLVLPDLYTAIWWYAGYPNHYAGEGDKATAELGRVLTESRIDALVRALKGQGRPQTFRDSRKATLSFVMSMFCSTK